MFISGVFVHHSCLSLGTLASDTAGVAEPLPHHKALTGGHISLEPRAVASASELAASKKVLALIHGD